MLRDFSVGVVAAGSCREERSNPAPIGRAPGRALVLNEVQPVNSGALSGNQCVCGQLDGVLLGNIEGEARPNNRPNEPLCDDADQPRLATNLDWWGMEGLSAGNVGGLAQEERALLSSNQITVVVLAPPLLFLSA